MLSLLSFSNKALNLFKRQRQNDNEKTLNRSIFYYIQLDHWRFFCMNKPKYRIMARQTFFSVFVWSLQIGLVLVECYVQTRKIYRANKLGNL